MSRSASLLVRSLGVAVLLVAGATMAEARCTKLGFSVNDYGKDGPTKDAKALLDKYIAEWTAARGIKNYRTGKKEVSCELFLDLLVFDEYTCKATATVCWSDKVPAPKPAAKPGSASEAPAKEPAKQPAKKQPAAAPAEAPAAPAPADAKPKST